MNSSRSISKKLKTYRAAGNFTPVELAMAYLESPNETCTVIDAVRWLGNMSGLGPSIQLIAFTDEREEDSNLVLKKSKTDRTCRFAPLPV